MLNPFKRCCGPVAENCAENGFDLTLEKFIFIRSSCTKMASAFYF